MQACYDRFSFDYSKALYKLQKIAHIQRYVQFFLYFDRFGANNDKQFLFCVRFDSNDNLQNYCASIAAPTKPLNNGCGRFGRDLNSGCACVARNHG